MGMFDTNYINGFEDIDLCLKMNKKKLRVLYTPECQIYHLESQTEGRNKYLAKNIKLFSDKWNEYIEEDESSYYKEDNIEIEFQKKDNIVIIEYKYDKNVEDYANLARQNLKNPVICEELYLKAIKLNKFAQNTLKLHYELANFYKLHGMHNSAINLYKTIAHNNKIKISHE